MTPREELIEIHRRVVGELKSEIQGSLYGDSPSLRAYDATYAKHFEGDYRLVSKDAVLASAFASDIVYHGDFHTLESAQRSAVRTLSALADSGREICLALEMFCADDQAAIDAFSRLELTEEEFLEAVRYEENWGFDWSHYRSLVYCALGRGIPILALDCRDSSDYVPLDIRDLFAAERIASRRVLYPDELLYVFCGELHLAPEHLPAAVERLLPEEEPRRTILFQNNESLYWRLACNGDEDATVIGLDDGCYCLMNSTPLVVYQSYRHWLERQEELAVADDGWWDTENPSVDLTEQVHQLVAIVSEFLGFAPSHFEDFTVYTSGDLDFLNVLDERYGLDRARLDAVLRDIEGGESLFVPEARIVYLPEVSLDRAAEEASRFIHFHAARYSRLPTEPRTAFYADVMTAALAFLGSKIVNHKRRARRPGYFRKLETRLRGLRGRRRSPEDARQIAVARSVLRHFELEDSKLSPSPPRSWPRNLYRLPRDRHREVTQALGDLLGDELWSALCEGRLRKDFVRGLYRTRYAEPRQARETYFDLKRRLRDTEWPPQEASPGSSLLDFGRGTR